MQITVHVPPDIPEAVEREAGRRRISRNRYIVDALKRALETERLSQRVPRDLLDRTKQWHRDEKRQAAITGMLAAIKKSRRSKDSSPL